MYIKCDARIDFKHHRLPPPITADRLQECMKRIEESKDEIIEGHLRLAMNLVSKFAKCKESNDLVGVAFLALVEAVNRLKPNMNAGAYINKSITWALRKHRFDNHALHASVSTYYRHGPKSRDAISIHQNEYEIAIVGRESVGYELFDILGHIAATPLEKEILELRSLGYCDRDVATQLGYSTSRIAQIRQMLYARFLLKWDV